MGEIYFSETDREKVLSEMKDKYHRTEFDLYSLGDTIGKLIWIGNVLQDIGHHSNDSEYVSEHAHDLRLAVMVTMLDMVTK